LTASGWSTTMSPFGHRPIARALPQTAVPVLARLKELLK
jgi:hypothetical protein